MADLSETQIPTSQDMHSDTPSPISPSAWRPSSAAIGQWEVRRYLELLRWPTLEVGAAVLAGILWWEFSDTWLFGLEAIAAVLFGLLATWRGGQRLEVLTAGIGFGFALGLIAAIGRLILQPHWTWALNLFSEPVLTGVAIGLISTSAHLVRKLFTR